MKIFIIVRGVVSPAHFIQTFPYIVDPWIFTYSSHFIVCVFPMVYSPPRGGLLSREKSVARHVYNRSLYMTVILYTFCHMSVTLSSCVLLLSHIYMMTVCAPLCCIVHVSMCCVYVYVYGWLVDREWRASYIRSEPWSKSQRSRMRLDSLLFDLHIAMYDDCPCS